MFGAGLEIKSPEQILLMREAGLVVADALAAVRDAVRPGITTADLDQVAADLIRSRGATPSFLGYGVPPFPATICASVNDAVVHGIPGPQVLAEGDVVSIDCGAIVDGWHGDAAITVAVGALPDEVTELMRVTEEALCRASLLPGSAAGSETSRTRSSTTCTARGLTGSSRTTPGTASAPRCTCRPTYPTTAGRGVARG